MEWWRTVLGVVPAAAVVSAVVTLLIRWFDRPRARLVFEAQLVESRYVDDTPGALRMTYAALTNVGDGTAFDVEITGHLCDAAVGLPRLDDRHADRYEPWVASIAPGATVMVRAGARVGDIEQAELVVRWDPSPGRPWRRVRLRMRSVLLSELEVAVPFPVGMLPPTPLPKRFRRWRDLPTYTARGRMRRRLNSGEEAEGSSR